MPPRARAIIASAAENGLGTITSSHSAPCLEGARRVWEEGAAMRQQLAPQSVCQVPCCSHHLSSPFENVSVCVSRGILETGAGSCCSSPSPCRANREPDTAV